MANADEDFDHPALPEGSELKKHCLYRLSRERRLQYTENLQTLARIFHRTP